MAPRDIGQIILLVAVVGGCARMVDAQLLIDAARTDILAAQSEFKDRTIKVQGTVHTKDLLSTPVVRVSGVSVGPHTSATGELSQRTHPVLLLGTEGLVRCHFNESHLDALAAVEVGRSVVVLCDFAGYQRTAENIVADLERCMLW